jgi:HemK-related putative methylase
VRRLWKKVLWWRFRLFQRHRHNRYVLEWVAGRPILVLPEVFNPKLFRSGALLAEALQHRLIPPGAAVLDMGTGSGIGAIVAAQWAGRVVGVDINPEAVRCARINALLNRVEDRVKVLEGDLFAPVRGQRFEVVLFNPPYFRGVPRAGFDQAWRATDVVERFAAGLLAHLTPSGRALVILSSDADTTAFLEAFRLNDLVAEVVFRRDLLNEVVTVYRLRADR